MLILPMLQNMHNPTTLINIRNHQQNDQQLMNALNNLPNIFQMQTINETEVIVRIKGNGEWKIVLPNALLHQVIRWYHLLLNHPGDPRLHDTIRCRFYNQNLNTLCMNYQCPDNCAMYKHQGRGYGHLAPRDAPIHPFEELQIHLIGPWRIDVGDTQVVFKALTMIDPATNLIEIIQIDNKSSKVVKQAFTNNWLARYLWPFKVIHDNGGEFMSGEFLDLLQQLGIVSRPTTVKNPKANDIVERSHKTITDMLRVMLHITPLQNLEDTNKIVDNCLASCMHAMICAYNHTMQTSPGAMVFNRDMMINITMIADINAIAERLQQLIDKNLIRLNAKRIRYNYNVGDRVMMVEYDRTKLQARTKGPYQIVRVFTNGTVRIQIEDHVQEMVNIRKLFPHKGEPKQ